jgi:hypothetical protein
LARARAAKLVSLAAMALAVIALVPGTAVAKTNHRILVIPAGAIASSVGHRSDRTRASHTHKCKKHAGKHGKKHKKCKKHHYYPPKKPSVTTEPPPPPPSPPPPPPEPKLEPAPKLDQVPGADVMQLPSGSSSTLIVGGEHSYIPDQFVTAAPGPGSPEGFLLKVISSHFANGNTEVDTVPGSLFEAVPNGEVNADLGDLSSATPLNAAARTLSRALANANASDPKADVPFSQRVSCDGSEEMTFSGTLSTSLEPHFELAWHKYFHIPVGIDRAAATVDADASASTQVTVSGAAECEISEATLFEPRWTKTIPIEGVPVPVTIAIPFKDSAKASASGALQISADASIRGSLGVQYEHGDTSGITELTTDANLTHSIKANASAEARTGPGLSIKAGWKLPALGELAATLGIDASSGLKLTYDSAALSPGALCVPFTATGYLTISLPDAPDLDVGSKKLYEHDIKCVLFGAVLLHWKGTVDLVMHPSWGEYNATEHWNVDGYTAQGQGDPQTGNLFTPGYTGSWQLTYHYLEPCTYPVGATQSGTEIANGSGSVADGNGTLEDTHLALYTTGSASVGGALNGWVPGGPPGESTNTWANCDGSTGSSSGPRPAPLSGPLLYGVGCAFDGTPRDGITLQGSTDCNGGNFDSNGEMGMAWNLTVTCPDGKAPNTEWICDPNE